jgi:hypothetical protein
MIRCQCPTCRADRFITRLSWLMIVVGIAYFVIQALRAYA